MLLRRAHASVDPTIQFLHTLYHPDGGMPAFPTPPQWPGPQFSGSWKECEAAQACVTHSYDTGSPRLQDPVSTASLCRRELGTE